MLAPLACLLIQSSSPDAVHVTVDKVDRLAYAFAPSKTSGEKPPILFMFHGHGGSALRCAKRFGMEKRWPEAVVVYLDGLPFKTAGGDGQGWQVAPKGNRDLRFFDALLPKMLAKYHADPKKVFAWGFSNGGMFVYTLWSQRASEFAGFCTSGSFIVGDMQLTQAKPAFVTVSGNDPVVPPTYQEQGLASAKEIDKSSKNGKPYGDSGTYFPGSMPVVVWRYNGGHEFPFEAFPKLVEFFRGIADEHRH